MITSEVQEALKRDFGYVPNERDGERWVVYLDRMLVVCHPERTPRVYDMGCNGSYYELHPEFPR